MRKMVLIFTTVLIAACGRSDYDYLVKVGATAGVGAFIGYGTIGSASGKFAAAVGFGAVGALIGLKMTGHLSQEDTDTISRTGYNSLTDSAAGSVSSWKNPASGHSGSFTPKSGYLTADGLLCRDYTATLTISGETEVTHQTACRIGIGSWTTVADANS